MKLASLKANAQNGSSLRDGELIVVSSCNTKAVSAKEIAGSLREALENWSQCEQELNNLSLRLESGEIAGFQIHPDMLMAALPRTFLFADGSAFIHHIKLVRKARNAELPATLETVPLVYQAESSRFLASNEDIVQVSESHGTDFEAELGVIVDDVPMGISAEKALSHIKLLVLINDVSLRGLIPAELAMGFGFFVSKPAKSLSPFAVTPDELGSAWQGGRVHLPLNIEWNREKFGSPNAGEMFFHFGQIISHVAQTRSLAAGTLIGSGTVSNADSSVGSGCIVEKRTIEQIQQGKPQTRFMKSGDQVRIWMDSPQTGKSIFGEINQFVRAVSK